MRSMRAAMKSSTLKINCGWLNILCYMEVHDFNAILVLHCHIHWIGIFVISRANCCMNLMLKIVEFCLYYIISQCMHHVMWTKSHKDNSIKEFDLDKPSPCTLNYKRCKIASPWPGRLAKWSSGLLDWESRIILIFHHRLHSPKY